jgi:hypothetical protein
VVQDLTIRAHVVNFRCERWQTPDGDVMTAPLPAGINGHFGPELRRFVLAQYHQGQMTVPRLVTLLRSLGILLQAPTRRFWRRWSNWRERLRNATKSHGSRGAARG